jgi:hypothetical protein
MAVSEQLIATIGKGIRRRPVMNFGIGFLLMGVNG